MVVTEQLGEVTSVGTPNAWVCASPALGPRTSTVNLHVPCSS